MAYQQDSAKTTAPSFASSSDAKVSLNNARSVWAAATMSNLELVLWTTQGVLFKAGYKDPKQRWWTESSIMLAAEVRSKTLVRERVTPDSDKTFWDPTLFTPNLKIAVRKQLKD
ncbi:hypothetical protein QFC20_006220 [Naganishia adeliensis]|uniref:Uncharacterized protein n=1 Tax=Naganishia adeliensis TaxID=92952 RepID=A0ACC2VEX6_9TREE|nr:hypothetical protein QFC20_006220 [Naganishia adeliensis]